MSRPRFYDYKTHVLWRRLFAHWIDAIVIGVLALAPAIVLARVADASVFDWPAGVMGAVLSLPYFVLLQGRDGRTPGKWLCAIQVVDAEGGVPTRRALVKRTVPLVLEWLAVLAWVAMLSSPYRQRFGDRWADTYVVAAGW